MKEKIFKVKEEIAWRKMKDGTLTIVSPITDKIISINETAGIIWEMLDGEKKVSDIADEMHKMFSENNDVSREVILSDVIEIISDFVERELLE